MVQIHPLQPFGDYMILKTIVIRYLEDLAEDLEDDKDYPSNKQVLKEAANIVRDNPQVTYSDMYIVKREPIE